MTTERFELRLPLKSQYVSVLRATVGAIGGRISFPYDEIVQLRVAVSEVLTLIMKHMPLTSDILQAGDPTEDSLRVNFVIEPDQIEMLMTCSADYVCRWDTGEWQESEAILESLMDEIGYSIDGTGAMVVRLMKRKSRR